MTIADSIIRDVIKAFDLTNDGDITTPLIISHSPRGVQMNDDSVVWMQCKVLREPPVRVLRQLSENAYDFAQ